jgi:hypothetical protein
MTSSLYTCCLAILLTMSQNDCLWLLERSRLPKGMIPYTDIFSLSMLLVCKLWLWMTCCMNMDNVCYYLSYVVICGVQDSWCHSEPDWRKDDPTIDFFVWVSAPYWFELCCFLTAANSIGLFGGWCIWVSSEDLHSSLFDKGLLLSLFHKHKCADILCHEQLIW